MQWELNDDILVSLNESSGVVEITSTKLSKMHDYNNRTDRVPWFDYRDNIVSIVVDDNIERIGDFTFMYCKNLSSVLFGDSVKEIGKHAFDHCVSLRTVSFSDNIERIEDNAFDFCDLYEINLPNKTPIDDNHNGLNYIGKEAFRFNSGSGSKSNNTTDELFYKYREINIPRSLNYIGTGAFSGMLYTFRLVVLNSPEGSQLPVPQCILDYVSEHDIRYVLEEEKG